MTQRICAACQKPITGESDVLVWRGRFLGFVHKNLLCRVSLISVEAEKLFFELIDDIVHPLDDDF